MVWSHLSGVLLSMQSAIDPNLLYAFLLSPCLKTFPVRKTQHVWSPWEKATVQKGGVAIDFFPGSINDLASQNTKFTKLFAIENALGLAV